MRNSGFRVNLSSPLPGSHRPIASRQVGDPRPVEDLLVPTLGHRRERRRRACFA
jgi:hypothetical protein